MLRKIFILEAKCPSCGTDGAYVGLNDVECQNRKCQHYQGIDTDAAKWQTIDVKELERKFPVAVRFFKRDMDHFHGQSLDYDDPDAAYEFSTKDGDVRVTVDDTEIYEWHPDRERWDDDGDY